MRQTVKVDSTFRPQVGDQVTLADGQVIEYPPRENDVDHLKFVCYARALGKVSREVSDPVPPEGYRLATEEDRKGPKPDNVRFWHPDTYEWCDLPYLAKLVPIGWSKGLSYAVPLPTPEPDSNLETSEVVSQVKAWLKEPENREAIAQAFAEADAENEALATLAEYLQGIQLLDTPVEIEFVVTQASPSQYPLVILHEGEFNPGDRVKVTKI